MTTRSATTVSATTTSRGACLARVRPRTGSLADRSGASSPHLRTFGASRSGNPGSPKPCRGNGGGSASNLCHAVLSSLSSNASGSAAAAFSASPMSLTLAVPSVGAGAAFVSNDASPGSCASTATCSMAFMPVFPDTWTGPRPIPPASCGGSSHRLGRFKTSKRGSATRHTGGAPSPGHAASTPARSVSRGACWACGCS
jgi:hypothetical protein